MRKILCCLTLLLFLPMAALGKTITLIDDETTARQFALCFFANPLYFGNGRSFEKAEFTCRA